MPLAINNLGQLDYSNRPIVCQERGFCAARGTGPPHCLPVGFSRTGLRLLRHATPKAAGPRQTAAWPCATPMAPIARMLARMLMFFRRKKESPPSFEQRLEDARRLGFTIEAQRGA